MSLSEVAASVGYESDSAFGAAFKRFAGCSPRRARIVRRAEGVRTAWL